MTDKDTIEYVWPDIKQKVLIYRSKYYTPPYLDTQDVHQEAYIALVKAYSIWIKDQRTTFQKYASWKVMYLLEDKFRFYRKDRNKTCNGIYPERIYIVKNDDGKQSNMVESDCVNIQGDLTKSLYNNIDLNILMRTLDDQEYFLIKEYYLNDIPMWVLGCVFGVSESRVYQVISRGLKDMEHYSTKESPVKKVSRHFKSLKVPLEAMQVIRALSNMDETTVKALAKLILGNDNTYYKEKLLKQCSYLIEVNCLLLFKKGRDNFLQMNVHPERRIKHAV